MPSTLPELFAHPFSSYCQKVLVALYEQGTPFVYRSLEQADARDELARLWPIGRFPVLHDGAQIVMEATTIIEYLQLHHPGPVTLLPQDAALAWQVRMLDRVFDNYLSTPQQKIVLDALRPVESRDPHGVDDARHLLDKAYAWLEAWLQDRQWAVGDAFSLADCGSPFPVLCRLDASDRCALRARAWLPPSLARAPILRPCR
ncbi:MAG TPA: glutathione S-transferase family protein [Stenotrophomonas sp.]|jgi:glutathione S-transferase